MAKSFSYFVDVECEDPPKIIEDNKENNCDNDVTSVGKENVSPVKNIEYKPEITTTKEKATSTSDELSKSFMERELKKVRRRLSADKKDVLLTGMPIATLSDNLW